MAGGDDLGFLDYLKAAFLHRPRIPGLGAMPLNGLGLAAFGVLGLLSPGFWFLGAALEVGYLTVLSSNHRFQAVVRGRKLVAERESYQDRINAALDRLSPPSRQRYHRLLGQGREILGISEQLDDYGQGSLRGRQIGHLNQLLWIFLRLLNSQELLQDSLRRVNRGDLEAQIGKLEKRIAAAEPGSPLAHSLNGTLEIEKKRLENLSEAERSLEVVNADLERIEKQVVLLREESVVAGKTGMLSERLDEVAGVLSETNRWMEQNAEIFGRLGADPLGSAPEDLPDLPEALETDQ